MPDDFYARVAHLARDMGSRGIVDTSEDALRLARGKALRDAIRFGVAAGSAAVMTPGTELCHREDAKRLYERMTVT